MGGGARPPSCVIGEAIDPPGSYPTAPINTMSCVRTGSGTTLSVANQVLITAVVCSLVFFVLGMLVGVLFLYWIVIRCAWRSKQSNNSTSPPVMYEDVSLHSHFQVRNDIELKENVAYGPIERVHPET